MRPLQRRLWLVFLLCYAAGAAFDIGRHLVAEHRAGRNALSPAALAVAVAAGLFWPIDLVADQLLRR